MERRRITIDLGGGRNNFHNAGPINILINPDDIVEYESGERIILITENQASRLYKHYCGISDCCCGSGPVFRADGLADGDFAISASFLDD